MNVTTPEFAELLYQDDVQRKLRELHAVSADLSSRGSGMNHGGYCTAILSIYEAAKRTYHPDSQIPIHAMPENHAGFMHFIEDRFPGLHRDLNAA